MTFEEGLVGSSLGTRPLKNRKGGFGKQGWGGSVHCGMLRILLIVEPSVASRALSLVPTPLFPERGVGMRL